MVFEEAISTALQETSPEQQQLLEKGKFEYFCDMSIQEYPSDTDLEAAQSRLRSYLRSELLKPAFLSKISTKNTCFR